nr:sigma factor-like helix-turn-helix DNA-binding protein [Brevibacillus brevis]
MLLADAHRLASRRYHSGDYVASDILIDLAVAIKSAKLTARQAEALCLYYVDDLTMEDVGVRMGIGKQRVSRLVITGLNRVAAVYARWNYGEVERTEQWRQATEDNAGEAV